MNKIIKNQVILTSNNSYSNQTRNRNEDLRKYLQSFPFLFNKSTHWREENQWDFALSGSMLDKYQFQKEKDLLVSSESIMEGKPSGLVFFPTEDTNHFSPEPLIEQANGYVERNHRRGSNNDNASYIYYRDALTGFLTQPPQSFTYALYDYIWTEGDAIGYSNIGNYPIENLTTVDISEIAPSTSETFFQKTSVMNLGFKNQIYHMTPSQIQSFCNLNSDVKIKMWDLKNLYRGTTPTQYNLVEKKMNAFSKGYKVALAKVKTKILCPQTLENVDAWFHFYITNVSSQSYNKYTKAKKFFQFLIEKSSIYNGSFFFNKSLFDKRTKEKFGTNTMYSNVISKIFNESTEEMTELKMNQNIQETTFDPSVFSIYSSVKKAKSNPTYSSYVKTKNKLQEFETKVANLTNSKKTIDTNIARRKDRILEYQNSLNEMKKTLLEKEKEKREIDVNLPNYIKAKETLTEKIKKQETEYNAYLNQITVDNLSDTNSYATNFAKQGIVIDKIEYSENNMKKIITNDYEVILSSLKTDSTICFNEIHFRILKPVTIYVDRAEKGEACRKIIGGPYSVRVDKNNLYISLLSSASVFGFDFNQRQLWVHPHTPNLNTYNCNTPQQFFNLILNSERRACLGEAAPAVHNAFDAKDIRQIIIAAMSWITNANSTDAWGKNQKYFQTLSELKDSSTMITKDFVQSQNIVSQLQDQEEIFNLFSDSVEAEEEILETEEPNLDSEPQEEDSEELPQINFSLRRPGVENYRPYNQN